MDSQRWQCIKKVLDEASQMGPEQRSGFLDRTCEGDTSLRTEVDSLLAYHDCESQFLDRPVFDFNAKDPYLGRRIGHYRMTRPLGLGGMGMVYLANREDDYSQEVALKLIRHGLGSRENIDRFHVERQILADLQHPSIARIFDGGTTEEGLPYLVMERVEGQPIDRYCDGHQLRISERLAIFGEVLAAVSASHRHLVVHRDLKPGNVLVTEDSRPKLIDFGIARHLPKPAGDGSGSVSQHRGPMTLRYASPEQVRGEPITTASDIYSLGILLYELLCGQHPYHSDTSQQDVLAQEICQTVPQPPSKTLAPLKKNARDSPDQEVRARARGTTARQLQRQLADDLDSIVLKAIHKEPAQRYRSVDELSEDLELHLTGRPVRAHHNTPGYRLTKWVRRKKLRLLVGGLAVALVVFLSVTVMTHSWAERERRRADAIGDFVSELFWDAHPDRADGTDLTVRELLSRGSDQLGDGLEDQPLVRATLLEVVGRVNKDLGNWEQAHSLLAEALELQQTHNPNDELAMARYENEVAIMLQKTGNLDQAEILYRQALDRIGGCRSSSPDTPWITGNLAGLRIEQGDLIEAETLVGCLRERKDLASGTPVLAGLLSKLGALRFHQQHFEAAERLFQEAFSIRLSYHGPLHTKVANSLNNLGRVLHSQGKHSAAQDKLRQALEIRIELLDAKHPDIANSKKNLAQVLLAQGHPHEAADLASEALEILRSKRHPGSWEVADAESVFGHCLVAQGLCSDAKPLLDGSFLVLQREKGDDSPYTTAALERLTLLDRTCEAIETP